MLNFLIQEDHDISHRQIYTPRIGHINQYHDLEAHSYHHVHEIIFIYRCSFTQLKPLNYLMAGLEQVKRYRHK